MAKTALDLTPKEWQSYQLSKALERREKQTAPVVEKRRRLAWDLAKHAAKLLRDEFGAKKVFVFGSLAYEQGYSPWSDIDLAVLGIPAKHFYSAVAAVTSLSSSFKLDLVDLVDCRSSLKKAIEEEGCEI